MGCDLQSFAERKLNGKWLKVEEDSEPFNWRSYSMFGFLANVRNYDCCEPISEPKGWPEDSVFLDSMDEDDFFEFFEDKPMTNKECIERYAHSWSYLTLKELLDFDYDKTFWNRRDSQTKYYEDGTSFTVGAGLAEEGEIVSYRENLGTEFFKQLEELKQFGDPEDVRVVFWFVD